MAAESENNAQIIFLSQQIKNTGILYLSTHQSGPDTYGRAFPVCNPCKPLWHCFSGRLFERHRHMSGIARRVLFPLFLNHASKSISVMECL
jgi:hypothetical protein